MHRKVVYKLGSFFIEKVPARRYRDVRGAQQTRASEAAFAIEQSDESKAPRGGNIVAHSQRRYHRREYVCAFGAERATRVWEQVDSLEPYDVVRCSRVLLLGKRREEIVNPEAHIDVTSPPRSLFWHFQSRHGVVSGLRCPPEKRRERVRGGRACFANSRSP